MSTFNTATQTSAPPWVRSRAVALHALCALGSFAIGSAFWGAVSGLFGLHGRAVRSPPLLMARRHAAGAPVSAAHGRSAGGDAGRDAVGGLRSSPTSRRPRPARWRWRSRYRIRAERGDRRSSTRLSHAARAAPARRRDVLAPLPRPGRSVALRRALHRHVLGRLPAPARRARRWPTRSSRRACARSCAEARR